VPNLAIPVALVLLLAAAGCGRVPKPPAGAVSLAHCVIVNLVDCEWRIAIAPVAGGEARALHLAARASQAVDLPGGDYMIEQTLLTADAGNDSSRLFSMRIGSRTDVPLESCNASDRPVRRNRPGSGKRRT